LTSRKISGTLEYVDGVNFAKKALIKEGAYRVAQKSDKAAYAMSGCSDETPRLHKSGREGRWIIGQQQVEAAPHLCEETEIHGSAAFISMREGA
jgi:hypothetical protein